MPLALALVAGGLATINPCGFALLSFYVGADDKTLPAAPTRLLQGLVVGLAVSAGFLAVFALVGIPISLGAREVTEAIPLAGVILGAAIALIGLWVFSGKRLSLPIHHSMTARRERRPRAMFLFGRLRDRLPRLHAPGVPRAHRCVTGVAGTPRRARGVRVICVRDGNGPHGAVVRAGLAARRACSRPQAPAPAHASDHRRVPVPRGRVSRVLVVDGAVRSDRPAVQRSARAVRAALYQPGADARDLGRRTRADPSRRTRRRGHGGGRGVAVEQEIRRRPQTPPCSPPRPSASRWGDEDPGGSGSSNRIGSPRAKDPHALRGTKLAVAGGRVHLVSLPCSDPARDRGHRRARRSSRPKPGRVVRAARRSLCGRAVAGACPTRDRRVMPCMSGRTS